MLVAVAVLFLLPHTVLGHLMAHPSYDTAHIDRSEYSNTWAVEIEGGKAVADRIAERYGFINKGQIGSLENMYLFMLKDVEGIQMPEMTSALRAESSVKYAEQQKFTRHDKKIRY